MPLQYSDMLLLRAMISIKLVNCNDLETRTKWEEISRGFRDYVCDPEHERELWNELLEVCLQVPEGDNRSPKDIFEKNFCAVHPNYLILHREYEQLHQELMALPDKELVAAAKGNDKKKAKMIQQCPELHERLFRCALTNLAEEHPGSAWFLDKLRSAAEQEGELTKRPRPA